MNRNRRPVFYDAMVWMATIFTCNLSSFAAFAQSASTTPPTVGINEPGRPSLDRRGLWHANNTRDEGSLKILRSAVAALGGENAIDALGNSTISATTSVASGRGDASENTVRWLMSKGIWAVEWGSGEKTRRISSGAGGYVESGKTANRVPHHIIAAMVTPSNAFLRLLESLRDTTFSISNLPDEQALDDQLHVLAISKETSQGESATMRQTWYFSASTNLPVKVIYRLPDRRIASRFALAQLEFANFSNCGAMRFPSEITKYMGSQQPVVYNVTACTPGIPSNYAFDPNEPVVEGKR